MRKLSSMVLALALVLVLPLGGCSLFSSDSVLKLGDYSYSDPKGLKYDNRVVLCNDDFGESLEESYNALSYPDTLVYDEEGNIIGMYDYDPETGLASAWTDLSSGTYTVYEAGEEVDLGKPDESMMIDLDGDVTMYCVVYDKDSVANDAWMYLMLEEGEDKDS